MHETPVASPGEKAPDLRELLRAARGGDGSAGARLIEQTIPTIYALARGYGRLRSSAGGFDFTLRAEACDEAEDTTLRTIHPLVTRLCRYRASRALEPWIWRVGLNVAFSRDAARDQAMTPGHAAALLLRAALGLEVEAISAVLGSPPDLIGPRIAHARRLLLPRTAAPALPGGCVEYQASVDAWLEDLLLGRERREFEAHLADCRACGEEATALRALDDSIRRTFQSDTTSVAARTRWAEAAAPAWQEECAGQEARREVMRRRRHFGLFWIGVLLVLALAGVLAMLRILR